MHITVMKFQIMRYWENWPKRLSKKSSGIPKCMKSQQLSATCSPLTSHSSVTRSSLWWLFVVSMQNTVVCCGS